jgi:hypothetical protein
MSLRLPTCLNLLVPLLLAGAIPAEGAVAGTAADHAATAIRAAPTASQPAPAALNPGLKYPTLASYQKAIKEPGILLDSPFVRLFAPKARTNEAEIIFPYLVRAYDELYRITGRGTRSRIVVYHFPPGHPDAKGGTSECTIWYDYGNLDLADQPEWTRYHVPHVAGYIEEMAHNFVDAARVQFGWEMIGWSLGVKVAQKVANNPILARQIQETRQGQLQTYQLYRRADCVFPKDIAPNLCDRIHARILFEAELKYGPNFWPDFFAQVRGQYDALVQAGEQGGDAGRNARYRITIDCFDKLDKVHFKDMLKQAKMSLTTDVKSLHPTQEGWDRTFLSAEDRSQAQ